MSVSVLPDYRIPALQALQMYYGIGSWLVGSSVDIMLMGVVACQVTNYFRWYKTDNIVLKLAVVGLLLINILKSFHAFMSIWHCAIDNYQDVVVRLTILLKQPEYMWFHHSTFWVALCSYYVQIYFCIRLLRFSKNRWWLVAPVFILLTMSCIASLLAVINPNFVQLLKWIGIYLGTGAAGDILLCGMNVFYLVRAKKNGLQQTESLVNNLIKITIESTAPAVLCAIINLIFSQMKVLRLNRLAVVFNTMLPKLYAISMMYTLNSRRGLRSQFQGSSKAGTSLPGPTAAYAYGTNHRATQDVEMGKVRTGPVQIQTQIETVQHVDLRDNEYGADNKYGSGDSGEKNFHAV